MRSSNVRTFIHDLVHSSFLPEMGRSQKDKEKFREVLSMDHPPLWGISYLNITRMFYGINHIAAIYGLYLLLAGHFASWSLLLFHTIYCYLGSVGTTAGAHRLWTHKAYKANFPLQFALMLMFTISAHHSIYKWALDHRIHHKYTDTDKDPHNSTRGFWFSHIIWIITPPHPEHRKVKKSFDMPDLEQNPVVLFNSRYFIPLIFLMYYFIPVQTSVSFWGLSWLEATCLNAVRWVYGTNLASAVNSFAHMFGCKPYNKDITSADNPWVSFFSSGEGWHNYHHTFPWDYKASEIGWKINITTMFIDFCAWMGWAYDLKTVSEEMLQEKMNRSGDGSHKKRKSRRISSSSEEKISQLKLDCETSATWGWDDSNVSQEFRKMTTILKPSLQ